MTRHFRVVAFDGKPAQRPRQGPPIGSSRRGHNQRETAELPGNLRAQEPAKSMTKRDGHAPATGLE
jgi:hypothetical protein